MIQEQDEHDPWSTADPHGRTLFPEDDDCLSRKASIKIWLAGLLGICPDLPSKIKETTYQKLRSLHFRPLKAEKEVLVMPFLIEATIGKNSLKFVESFYKTLGPAEESTLQIRHVPGILQAEVDGNFVKCLGASPQQARLSKNSKVFINAHMALTSHRTRLLLYET